MKYHLHKSFVKAYRKLPDKLKKAVKEKLVLFCEDPFLQELNNHALTGKYQGYRSINITGDYRAVYKEIGKQEVIFVILGSHSQIYG